jgi:NADPH:quinone reductase
VLALITDPNTATGLERTEVDELEAAAHEAAVAIHAASAGGASLAQAIERVAPGGTIVVFGSSSGEPTPLGFRH